MSNLLALLKYLTKIEGKNSLKQELKRSKFFKKHLSKAILKYLYFEQITHFLLKRNYLTKKEKRKKKRERERERERQRQKDRKAEKRKKE